jgi:hypothetical protein
MRHPTGKIEPPDSPSADQSAASLSARQFAPENQPKNQKTTIEQGFARLANRYSLIAKHLQSLFALFCIKNLQDNSVLINCLAAQLGSNERSRVAGRFSSPMLF